MLGHRSYDACKMNLVVCQEPVQRHIVFRDARSDERIGYEVCTTHADALREVHLLTQYFTIVLDVET
jgi:hypothetical protein